MLNPQNHQFMTITKALKKLVLLAQCFGFFPVLGISLPEQRFTYRSFRMLFSLFFLAGSVFLCVMQLNKAVRTKMGIDQIDYIAKYVSSAYVSVVFIELAKEWPKLMQSWRNVETDMKGYGFPRGLNRRITILIAFFMVTFSGMYAENFEM